MKKVFMTVTGLFGSLVVRLFGGWDAALQTLILFMALDWITGGIILRRCSRRVRSQKTERWRAGQDGKACAGRE